MDGAQTLERPPLQDAAIGSPKQAPVIESNHTQMDVEDKENIALNVSQEEQAVFGHVEQTTVVQNRAEETTPQNSKAESLDDGRAREYNAGENDEKASPRKESSHAVTVGGDHSLSVDVEEGEDQRDAEKTVEATEPSVTIEDKKTTGADSSKMSSVDEEGLAETTRAEVVEKRGTDEQTRDPTSTDTDDLGGGSPDRGDKEESVQLQLTDRPEGGPKAGGEEQDGENKDNTQPSEGPVVEAGSSDGDSNSFESAIGVDGTLLNGAVDIRVDSDGEEYVHRNVFREPIDFGSSGRGMRRRKSVQRFAEEAYESENPRKKRKRRKGAKGEDGSDAFDGMPNSLRPSKRSKAAKAKELASPPSTKKKPSAKVLKMEELRGKICQALRRSARHTWSFFGHGDLNANLEELYGIVGTVDEEGAEQTSAQDNQRRAAVLERLQSLAEEALALPQTPEEVQNLCVDGKLDPKYTNSIALIVQSSPLPLSALASLVAERVLAPLGEDITDEVRSGLLSQLETCIPMVAERVPHGFKPRNVVINEHTAPECMWSWEVQVLESMPQPLAGEVRKSRKERRRLGSFLRALITLIDLYSKNIVDHAKVSQEEAKVQKYERECEAERLRRNLKLQQESEKRLRGEERNGIDFKRRKCELEDLEDGMVKSSPSLFRWFAKSRCGEGEDPHDQSEEREAAVARAKAQREALVKQLDKELRAGPGVLADQPSTGEEVREAQEAETTDGQDVEPCGEKTNDEVQFQQNVLSTSTVAGTSLEWKSQEGRKANKALLRRGRIESYPFKLLQFHDNYRPAYFGTWGRGRPLLKHVVNAGRKPFGRLPGINYDVDSDEEWEEEEPGESLSGSESDDEEEADEPLENGGLARESGFSGRTVAGLDYSDDWLAPENIDEIKPSTSETDPRSGKFIKQTTPIIAGPIFVGTTIKTDELSGDEVNTNGDNISSPCPVGFSSVTEVDVMPPMLKRFTVGVLQPELLSRKNLNSLWDGEFKFFSKVSSDPHMGTTALD